MDRTRRDSWVIVAVLAVTALVLVGAGPLASWFDDAPPWVKQRQARFQLEICRHALEEYASLADGEYPAALSERVGDAYLVVGRTAREWRDPRSYIRHDERGVPFLDPDLHVDPWGTPIEYAWSGVPGERPTLRILGADGEPGGSLWNRDVELEW